MQKILSKIQKLNYSNLEYILEDTEKVNNLFYFLPEEEDNSSLIDYSFPKIINDLGFYAPVNKFHPKKMTSIFNYIKLSLLPLNKALRKIIVKDFITIVPNSYISKINNKYFTELNQINLNLLERKPRLKYFIENLINFYRWTPKEQIEFIKESRDYYFTLQDCKNLIISNLIHNETEKPIDKEIEIISSITDLDINNYIKILDNPKKNYSRII